MNFILNFDSSSSQTEYEVIDSKHGIRVFLMKDRNEVLFLFGEEQSKRIIEFSINKGDRFRGLDCHGLMRYIRVGDIKQPSELRIEYNSEYRDFKNGDHVSLRDTDGIFHHSAILLVDSAGNRYYFGCMGITRRLVIHNQKQLLEYMKLHTQKEYLMFMGSP